MVPAQSLEVLSSKSNGAAKPKIYLRCGPTKSAHTALDCLSNILPHTAPQPAATAGFLQARPRFTVRSPAHQLFTAAQIIGKNSVPHFLRLQIRANKPNSYVCLNLLFRIQESPTRVLTLLPDYRQKESCHLRPKSPVDI